MAQPYEQDVVLDADGKPLFAAMDIFQRRVEAIQKLITNIQKDSYKSVADFNKTLDANVKELRNALTSIRTLSQPGKKDVEFTAAIKEQSQQLKKNYDEARTFSKKETSERVADNRTAIRQITADEREGQRLIAEQNRKRTMADIANEREVDKTRKLSRAARLEAAKAENAENAKAIRGQDALARARADNIDKLQRYRAAAKLETNPEQLRALSTLIDMEKARGKALEQNGRAQDAAARRVEANARTAEAASRRVEAAAAKSANIDVRTQKAALPAQALNDVNKYGIVSAREQAGYQQRVAQQQLLTAATDRERVSALQALDVARARVAAVEAIARAQTKVSNEKEREAAADRQLDGRSNKLLARSFAADQIAAVGPVKAIADATAARAAAEARLSVATGQQRVEALKALEIANARLRATEAQVRAAERLANAERKANTPVGAAPAGPESRIGNILSPGYAGAAFARTAVYGAAAGAAYGAFNTAQTGLSNAIQMEDELAKLQAIANATDTTMQRLKGSIFAIGETSRFATVDLIKISQTLAQAGVSAGEMENVLKAVTSLATASGSTPDEAVQLVTSALGSFQLQGSEAARVADLMTEALNRTKLTVQQVGQAIQYVGATAYEQNIGLEQLLATVGAVAQAGVKSGSTIGTGFRQFLVDLQSPSKKLTEQMELLGLTASDVDVKVRGLPAVLETLRDAGFGAAQAYEGLEVRAAAFYLTAKNNIDVSDRLQASFAYSNASIVAQERAMNSLAAQWQRFKNIIGQGFAESMDSVLNIMKNVLTQISDRIKLVQDIQSGAQQSQVRKDNPNIPEWLTKDYTQDAMDTLEQGLNGRFRDTDTFFLPPELQGLGTWLRELEESSDGATDASERLATQLAESSDTVEQQRGKIAELDQEMIRLITQKESLVNNDVRSAAETATLTSRFVGLANQLVITGNRYEDLISAARRYRLEQNRVLGVQLQAQQLQLGQAVGQARGSLNSNINAALSTPGLAITQQERAALVTMGRSNVNSPEFSRAFGILAGAIDRLGKASDKNLSVLTKIAGPAGSLAQNVAQRDAIGPLVNQARQQQTEVGQNVVNTMQNVEATIQRLGSAEGADKTSLARQGNNYLNNLERNLNIVLGRTLSSGARTFVEQALADIPGMRQQIKALTTATAAETKEAKSATDKADRDRQKAEREANRGPVLTQNDIDDVIKQTLGAGVRLGSGTRTLAEQNALADAGRTRARGNSNHVSGLARDIPWSGSDSEGERMAQALRVAYKNKGINAQVLYETGKGRNQGTGKHIHVGADRGQRLKPSSGDSEEQAAFEYDSKLDQAQLELDRQALAEKLKDIATATTKETFDAAVVASRTAMEKVNDGLRQAAANELANAGIADSNDPRFMAKMQQVNQAIAQNVEAFNRQVADGIIKSLQATLKAAQEAFDKQLQPSLNRLSIAEGMAEGLNSYSLRNRVPEQTRVLADANVARSKEAADRVKLAALPGLITQQRQALFNTQLEASKQGLSQDESNRINAQIVEITNNIDGLVNTRDRLAAALGAEGLIPTTLGGGLQQAIAAYSELNNLNATFTQTLNGEMLGGITLVSNALGTMFQSILEGSSSVGSAMATFAKSIISAIQQIITKIIATQIIKLLFTLFGGAFGAKPGATDPNITVDLSNAAPGAFGRFHGGEVPGFAGGGEVMTGHSMRDSTLAKLAKGEWVMRKAAVDSVGKDFMHNLNRKGAAALDTTKNVTPVAMKAEQEVNVWLVKPDEMPQMGPNDVIATFANDALSGGETRRIIKHIAREA